MSVQERKASSKVINWVFGVIMLLGGIAGLVLTYSLQTQAKASQAWPSTEGEIIASYVEETRDDEQDLSYIPRIQYVYVVEGQPYTSQRVKFRFEQSYGFYNRAEKKLADYPIGAKVTVYYDPAVPTNAVLDNSSSPVYIGYLIAGIIFIIGSNLLISSFRRKESSNIDE